MRPGTGAGTSARNVEKYAEEVWVPRTDSTLTPWETKVDHTTEAFGACYSIVAM